jgi:hypothetical protein
MFAVRGEAAIYLASRAERTIHLDRKAFILPL